MSTDQKSVPVAPEAVSFPPEEIKKTCDEIVSRYPTRQAACLPGLHVAQTHYRGWISPAVTAGLARALYPTHAAPHATPCPGPGSLQFGVHVHCVFMELWAAI